MALRHADLVEVETGRRAGESLGHLPGLRRVGFSQIEVKAARHYHVHAVEVSRHHGPHAHAPGLVSLKNLQHGRRNVGNTLSKTGITCRICQYWADAGVRRLVVLTSLLPPRNRRLASLTPYTYQLVHHTRAILRTQQAAVLSRSPLHLPLLLLELKPLLDIKSVRQVIIRIEPRTM